MGPVECDKRPKKEFLHRLDQVLIIDWASRTALLILLTLHPAWKTSVCSRAPSTSCSSLGFTQWNGCAHLTWLGWLHVLMIYELKKPTWLHVSKKSSQQVSLWHSNLQHGVHNQERVLWICKAHAWPCWISSSDAREWPVLHSRHKVTQS